MAVLSSSTLMRGYRTMTPKNFHGFNQRVFIALSDHVKVPELIWAANPSLLENYLATSEKHDAVYHQASYGSRLDIAQREVLQAQLVAYLDEIASVLEAAAVRNPDVLLYSGFDLAKERRSSSRTTKAAIAAAEALAAEHHENQA